MYHSHNFCYLELIFPLRFHFVYIYDKKLLRDNENQAQILQNYIYTVKVNEI